MCSQTRPVLTLVSFLIKENITDLNWQEIDNSAGEDEVILWVMCQELRGGLEGEAQCKPFISVWPMTRCPLVRYSPPLQIWLPFIWTTGMFHAVGVSNRKAKMPFLWKTERSKMWEKLRKRWKNRSGLTFLPLYENNSLFTSGYIEE